MDKRNSANGVKSGMGLQRAFLLKILALMLVLGLSVSVVSGCGQNKETDKAVEKPAPVIDEFSQELDGYMAQMPASWIYTGTAEYAHIMSLGEVQTAKGQKLYRVFGEVEDMSGGESAADFSFELTYAVTGDRLIQTQKGEMLLDSKYRQLTLLKLPVERGGQWTETVEASDGKKAVVVAVIEEVQEEEGTVTVRYSEQGSEYYEKRVIKQNTGVVSFEKLLFYDGDSFEIQYALLKIDREKTLIVKGGADGSESVKHKPTKSNEHVVDIDPILPEGAEGTTDAEDEEDLVRLINEFNEAWTGFVNDLDMDVLGYVTEDGEAYGIIQRFPAGTMLLEFELIDVTSVLVDGDRANLRVHEIIRKETDGKVEMLEYFWLYEARRVDGVWRVHSYVGE